MKKKLICILILLMIFVPFISVGAKKVDLTEESYMNYVESYKSCGSELITDIPELIPKVVKIVYLLIQISVPVVLTVFGCLDLFKSMSAQKEEEIKKGQQMFIKRLVSAAIVFFVFAITKIIISFAADETGNDIIECVDCFLEAKCDN